MRQGERHINHAYRLRGECCREGCEHAATDYIRFFGYRDVKEKDRTYACAKHARWWIVGLHGLPLGIRLGIA